MESRSLARQLGAAVLVLALGACGAKPTPDVAATTAEKPAAAPIADVPSTSDVTAEYPALRLPAVDGSTYDLADSRGRWVVVNFWATWCAPCLKEMPELSELNERRTDVDVVGLAYDDIELADMQAFLQKTPVSYPVVIIDTFDPPKDFATPRGLPMTYLLSPEGKLTKQFLGPVTAADIEAAIAKGA